MSEVSIEAHDLNKVFGGFQAVKGIAFRIQRGECFGFLGPNGAGKTSTMRMIGCVSPVSSGTLKVLGLDVQTHPRAVKSKLGVVPQEDNLDEYLDLRENLELYGGYFGLDKSWVRERTDALLRFVQLHERAHANVRTLSGGMRRRLLIARALVSDPAVVLLDEPTTGLDPQARHLLWERLRALKAEARTLVLTTHYMDEAETLCDRLVIMDQGDIVVEGTPSELIREHVSREVVEARGERSLRDALAARFGARVQHLEQLQDRTLFFVSEAEPLLRALLATEEQASLAISTRRASLEDVFLKLTGHALIEP